MSGAGRSREGWLDLGWIFDSVTARVRWPASTWRRVGIAARIVAGRAIKPDGLPPLTPAGAASASAVGGALLSPPPSCAGKTSISARPTFCVVELTEVTVNKTLVVVWLGT